MERYIALLRPLFWPDPELPKETMRFVFPQLQLIAAQGGMSLVHCLGIQEAYYYALEHAETAEDVIQVLKNQCRELTEIISEMKAEKVFSEVTRRCRDYIRNHLYEDLSIPALAEALAFSESYLSRRFREETGKSIRTFIREERVAEAKLLMRANFPNAQIASLLGFASQSHFTDIFKRETGTTPT